MNNDTSPRIVNDDEGGVHRIWSFDRTAVQFAIGAYPDGEVSASIDWQDDREPSPTDLRALADLYESFPGWLRSRAEDLEEALR